MDKITIQVPDELSRDLEPYRDQLDEVLRIGLRELKMAQSLGIYRKGGLSLWKAARLAGVSRREMAQYAVAQGLQPPYDEEMIKEEIA
jgi:predicted HTH domain antitoxin